MLRWLLLLCMLLLQTACNPYNDQERPTSPVLNPNGIFVNVRTDTEPLTTTTLLGEPTTVYRFETMAAALSVWRRAAAEQPTLLLLSNNPHLQPVPEELRKQVSTLVNTADVVDIALAGSDRNPEPLLLSGMTVDAALRNGWFRELAWVLPLRDQELKLSLDKFSAQLKEAGIADAQEATSLTLNGRSFHGSIRGTNFTAAALAELKELQQPVVVHIDLSYFQPLYKNEIATPMLDIIFNTLMTLKKMQLKTLAVTFSYGHLDNQISLDVRFLGEIITELIENPVLLDQPIPLNWQRQRDALYLGNFFQKEKVRELYEAQEQEAPDKAWIKFNLYRSASAHKEGGKALELLAQAVSLDHLFALEYIELSKRAYASERPDEALRMLKLASDSFQNDTFIKLQMAQLAAENGKQQEALRLLKQLNKLQWSEVYYADMPGYLANFIAYLQNGNRVEEATIPKTKQLRQRILHSR